jgi:hypothetical protein
MNFLSRVFGIAQKISHCAKHQFGQRGPKKAHEADLSGESAVPLLCPIEHYGVLLSYDAFFVEDEGNSGYYLSCSLEIPDPE